MLRFVANPRDGISFHRIANKPAAGMGDDADRPARRLSPRRTSSTCHASMQERISEFIPTTRTTSRLWSRRSWRVAETRRIFDLHDGKQRVADVAAELLRRSSYEGMASPALKRGTRAILKTVIGSQRAYQTRSRSSRARFTRARSRSISIDLALHAADDLRDQEKRGGLMSL
jgi:hypothetical protein